MKGINWNLVTKSIHYSEEIISPVKYVESNPSEAVDVAKNGGVIYDLDNMVHLKDLLGFSVSWNLYIYIDKHYDGGLLELEEEDLPALHWLVEDYVKNGAVIEKQDIWQGYDFAAEEDEYGFCGWHKRVREGLK